MKSMPSPYKKVECKMEVIAHHSSLGAIEVTGPKPVNTERVIYSFDCIYILQVHC